MRYFLSELNKNTSSILIDTILLGLVLYVFNIAPSFTLIYLSCLTYLLIDVIYKGTKILIRMYLINRKI